MNSDAPPALLRRQIKLHARSASVVAATFLASTLVAGCAVQTTRDGKLHVSIDQAEVLGETVHTFRLADGGEGRLRKLGDTFSLKLQQYLRVIPIANATSVGVVSARRVNDRTLLVLAKTERNCAYRAQILSIKGAEVSGWEIGDCASAPQITYTDDMVYFDLIEWGRPARYTYRDGKLLKGERSFPDLQGAQVGTGKGNARLADDKPRYSPPLPIALGATPTVALTQAVAKAAPAARPAVKKQSAPSAPTQPNLKFKEQEQKATIILILDK